jgi:hypothetical protein
MPTIRVESASSFSSSSRQLEHINRTLQIVEAAIAISESTTRSNPSNNNKNNNNAPSTQPGAKE